MADDLLECGQPGLAVSFGECTTLDDVYPRINGEGVVMLSPDAIRVAGNVTYKYLPLLLTLCGHGGHIVAHELEKPRKISYEVDPAKSRIVCDEAMQCIGLQLPSGQWLALVFDKPVDGEGEKSGFHAFLESLHRVYGGRVAIETVRLEMPGASSTFLIVALLFLAGIVSIVAMVVLKNR